MRCWNIEAPTWIHLAYASYDLGEFERAQDELAHLEVLMADRPPQERQLTVGAMPAFIELQRGNDDRAHELLLAAKEAAVEWGNGPVEFYALLGLAEWAARNEPAAAPQYLEQAHAVVALHSPKSAAQSRFLLALHDLASGNFHAAMDRLTYLRASERAPARPQDWNAALDATIWLASILAGGSDVPPPPSNLGSLMAAVLAAIRGQPEELDALLDDRPPSTWTIPGLYLLRIDDVARRLAAALASSIVLRLEPQARRIQVGDSEIIDMSRRAAGRRILDHLAAVHDATPGAPVDVSDLIEVGWPDELILHDAALSRVYTTMNRLRGLGLSEILITIDDGYALARTLRVERVDQL